MEASWLPVFLSAAVFLAIVLLAVVCLDCGNKGPMASIRQASDDYMQSTDFRIIHPSAHTTTTLNSPSHLLSPYPNSVDGGIQRHRSFTPTETESNPSYENPGPESLDSDCEEPGYITVLADGPDPPPDASRASTPSSDAQHEYVNVKTPSTSTIEDTEYQNVVPLHGLTISCYENPDVGSDVPPAVIPELLAQCDSNEDESSDDDDDEGNYVNQPMDLQTVQCMMGRVNDL